MPNPPPNAAPVPARPSNTGRPLSKPVKALAVGLVSILAALACVEVAVRLLGLDAPTTDALRHHPRFGWTQNPGHPGRDGVAADGFRHPELAREKPAGVRRLVILGDSFAQGTAYPYPATFAGLVGEWLERGTGERWEVINLGVSGWGTGQQYLALRDVGLAYRPDAVVLQSLPFNDLCNNALDLAHVCDTEDSYRPYFVLDDDGELRLTWEEPWRLRLRRSALFRLLERRLPALAPPAPEDAPTRLERSQALVEFHRRHAEAAGLAHRAGLYTLLPDEYQPPAMQRVWVVTERLVDEVAELTVEAGVPLVGVVVPFADTFDPAWVERNSRPGRWPRPPEPAPLDPVLGTARMERMLAERGAAVIPMRERVVAGPMEPADFFYPYGKTGDRHFNRYGHFEVAAWIVDELRRLDLTSARPPAPTIDRVDLLADAGYPVAVRGLAKTRDHGGGRHRLAHRPVSRLAFQSDAAVPMRLRLAAKAREGTEAIEVLANGAGIGVLELGGDGPAEADFPFTAEPGRNEIRLVYRGWKRNGQQVAAEIAELVLERD